MKLTIGRTAVDQLEVCGVSTGINTPPFIFLLKGWDVKTVIKTHKEPQAHAKGFQQVVDQVAVQSMGLQFHIDRLQEVESIPKGINARVERIDWVYILRWDWFETILNIDGEPDLVVNTRKHPRIIAKQDNTFDVVFGV